MWDEITYLFSHCKGAADDVLEWILLSNYFCFRWIHVYFQKIIICADTTVSDNKVHGSNMGPTWVLLAPDWPHFGPMNLACRGVYPKNTAMKHNGYCSYPYSFIHFVHTDDIWICNVVIDYYYASRCGFFKETWRYIPSSTICLTVLSCLI